jgi:hypothetical protein
MNIKNAIKQLTKLSKIHPNAELYIEYDEFPGWFGPVLDFDVYEAGQETALNNFSPNSLERKYDDDDRNHLKNIRNIIVCSGQEP